MKEKLGILLGSIVIILVLLTLAFYIVNAKTIEISELMSLAIVIILVLAASYIIWDRARNVRRGLPIKDERLINISYKAGYYGFISAIWSAVFGPVIIDILFGYELESSRVSAVVVIVSGFVFMISYLYLYRKGS